MSRCKRVGLTILTVMFFIGCICSCDKQSAKRDLSIYSLYENEEIRKCILLFNEKNKDIEIKYEVGIEEKSGITKSDAIKTLNSELMSGKGPDIIFLDDLSKENFIEKGLLKDISDIVDENKDVIFKNLVELSTVKNKIYSIPLRIKIPKIIGRNLDGISDLSSFANKIEEESKNSDEKLLDVYTAKELIELLYYSSFKSWIDEENNINEDNIRDFLINTKKIYDCNIIKLTEEDKINHENTINYYKEYIGEDGIAKKWYLDKGDLDTSLLFSNSPKYDIGNIESIYQLYMLNAYEKFDVPIYNKNWSGQIGEYYIPTMMVSINNNSTNIDKCKEFIEYLINNYDDNIDVKNGFTINKNILKEKMLENNEMSGLNTIGNSIENIEVEVPELSEEEINQLINSIEEIKVEANVDTRVLDKILEDMGNYISGQVSLDNTINIIRNKTEILLTE